MSTQQTGVTDFPLRGIQLLEASAGTGKTWNISSLYVRLILGHGRDNEGLSPHQILVVTFTKAATQELQDRIRKRLNETARFIRSLEDSKTEGQHRDAEPKRLDDPLLEGLKTYYDQHPEHRSPHAHRLSLAADAMDDAAIYTIHGWCQRMLKQHAFDSGSLFDLTIETDEAELLRESVRDYWRTVVYPLDKGDVERIHSVAKDPDDLLKKIRNLLTLPPETLSDLESDYPGHLAGIREALSAWSDWEQRIEAAESHARTTWAKEATNIERVIQDAKKAGTLNNRSYTVKVTEWLATITAWANHPEIPSTGINLERFATGKFKLDPKGSGQEPENPAFQALADYLEVLEEGKAKLRLKGALLAGTTLWVRDHYERIKNDRAVIDQNDLILKLHEATHRAGGQRLASIIRKQYPVALIDEFQDTDPLQYGIFKTIYENASPENAWLMVGDPKQAIYSFRGADIYSYLDARRQDGVQHHTLTTNFRSTREMVTAVNQVFSHAEQWNRGAFGFPADSSGNQPIRFEPVDARDRSERLYQQRDNALHPISGLRIWSLQNDQVAIGADEYKAQMAEVAANTIVDLLNQSRDHESPGKNAVFFAENGTDHARCLVPSDIAILVASWSEADAIRDALRTRGLQSVYLSDRDSILKTEEACDLALWLEAFISPREGRRVRAAMATGTLKLPYPTLLRLTTDELFLDGVIERFVGYGALWREKGILPAIHQFILDQELPSQLIHKGTGERALTNLLHLAEVLQREASNLDGQNGLLRFLREAIQDSGNDEENILRLESDSALIRVITIHKSKGLEFPLVFLPFIAMSRPLDEKKDYYKFHDPALKLKISLTPETDTHPSPLVLAEQERLQEDLRLLYVGLTRAQHACWIGVGPYRKGASSTSSKNDLSTSLHQSALGYALKGGDLIQIPEIDALLQSIAGTGQSIEILPAAVTAPVSYLHPAKGSVFTDRLLTFEGAPFEIWRIDSYSRLLGYVTHGDPESRQDNEERNDRTVRDTTAPHLPGLLGFPAGPTHGDFLHKLLQKAGNAGFDRVSKEANLRQSMVTDALALQSYTPEWQEKLSLWLEQFIACPFQLESQTLQLANLGVTDCRMELEFWFEVKQANLQAIDRIVTQHILPGQGRPALKSEHLNGMLKGFIDLTFRFGQQFYVADYKSNRLGKTPDAFTEEAQNMEVLKHRYDLQYSLYTLALHRYLRSRIGASYDYDRWIGGVAYFFLRGIEGPTQGLHFVKPSRILIEELDAIFSGRSTEMHHVA